MSDDGMMTAREVADLLGIGAGSWRSLLAQGYAPEPDDFGLASNGLACNLWRRSTIEKFIRERKGRGYRSDLPGRRAG